ncbi:MAG: hypothetical protein ABI068_09600 [Ktedonobacterales bacterium]
MDSSQQLPTSNATAPAVVVPAAFPTPQRCPMCSNTVAPDALGLFECPCGWEGPGDPLETTHGLNRFRQRLSRRMTAGVAKRDLAHIASGRAQAASSTQSS